MLNEIQPKIKFQILSNAPLNEYTPWIDGAIVLGTTKAWADQLCSFRRDHLADYARKEESNTLQETPLAYQQRLLNIDIEMQTDISVSRNS